jgi:hypothetical protein
MEGERDDTDINVGIKERPTSTTEGRKVSAEDWDKMMRALCVYRLGGMGFLELLAAWEDILGIVHPLTIDQQ